MIKLKLKYFINVDSTRLAQCLNPLDVKNTPLVWSIFARRKPENRRSTEEKMEVFTQKFHIKEKQAARKKKQERVKFESRPLNMAK